MSETLEDLPQAAPKFGRCVGSFRGESPGPLLICVGGIHGNEPHGLHAARAVLRELERIHPPFRGEFIAFAGNLQALSERRRFVEKDLNRQWVPERIEAIRSGREIGSEGPEDREQRELLDAIQSTLSRAGTRAYFIDLHTSSADGPPFLSVGDTLRNRAFASHFPLPAVLGLEEQIDGPLLEFVSDLGHVTLGVEGGQHGLEASVANLESVLWLALHAAGNLEVADLPSHASHRERLEQARAGLPRTLEVYYRHSVLPEDRFRMRPGYRNLQHVSEGEVIADDRTGPIRTREAGCLLLPLYQGQGNDGFFLAREVKRLGRTLSAGLRWLGLPALAHWLPGVRRHPGVENVLLVNTRVARLYPLELFHLLGYRKRRRQGDWLVVSRRRHDLRTPHPRP